MYMHTQEGALRLQLQELSAAHEHLRAESSREIRRLKRQAKTSAAQLAEQATEMETMTQLKRCA